MLAEGKSLCSIIAMLEASPFSIWNTLICATAAGESSCWISASNKGMASAGPATSSELARTSGVICTSFNTPDFSSFSALSVEQHQLQ